MYTFGHWLLDQMRARRVQSAKRLAQEAGLNPGRVADWVLDRDHPSTIEAIRLARYLRIPVDRVHFFAGDAADSLPRGA